MTNEEFPGCCGIQIIYEFPEEGESDDNGGPPCTCDSCVADRDVDLSKWIKTAKESAYGAVMATTNHFQPKTEEKLTAAGFVVIHSFVSPKTNNNIKVWLYAIVPEPKAKAKAKGKGRE